MSWPNQRSRESGSRCSVRTLVLAYPNRPVRVTGATRSAGSAPGEPGVGPVVPVHRRSHCVPAVQSKILGHADLLAVPQHRGAGHAELERVGELDAAQVATHHGGQPPANSSVVQTHLGLRCELGEHVRALLRGQPAQVQFVVISQERRPLRHRLQVRQVLQRLDERFGLLAGQCEPEPGVEQEGEHHVRAVVRAVEGVAGVLVQVGGVDVGLTQQDGLTTAPLHVLAPLVEDLEVRFADNAVRCDGLQDERRGVDPEPRHPQLQPEPHHLADLEADRRVLPVQVGLETVEAVVVPGAGLVVQLQVSSCSPGKDHALLAVGRLLVAPHVQSIPQRR